jgi:hypothetical protein
MQSIARPCILMTDAFMVVMFIYTFKYFINLRTDPKRKHSHRKNVKLEVKPRPLKTVNKFIISWVIILIIFQFFETILLIINGLMN